MVPTHQIPSPGFKSDILHGKTGRIGPQPPASSHIWRSLVWNACAVTLNYNTIHIPILQGFFKIFSDFFQAVFPGPAWDFSTWKRVEKRLSPTWDSTLSPELLSSSQNTFFRSRSGETRQKCSATEKQPAEPKKNSPLPKYPRPRGRYRCLSIYSRNQKFSGVAFLPLGFCGAQAHRRRFGVRQQIREGKLLPVGTLRGQEFLENAQAAFPFGHLVIL